MKVHLYVVADEYARMGWRLQAIPYVNGESAWDITVMDENDSAFILKIIDIDHPDNITLQELGLHHVEVMEDQLRNRTVAAQRLLKEYESKFMLLTAPQETPQD